MMQKHNLRHVSAVFAGLCFTVLFVVGAAVAQDPQSVNSGSKKLEIGAVFSPDYAFRVITSTDGSQTAEAIREGRDNREIAKLGMTAGFHLGYQLTDNLRLESGLIYADKGYRTRKMDAKFGDALDPRRGITLPEASELTHVRFIESFHYIAVPLKVNFSFGGEKWKWLAGIGVMNEFLVEATNTALIYGDDEVTDGNTETSGTDLRQFSLSPLISVGVEYVLSPNMSLRAEPTFRYGVLQTTDTSFSEHLYSAGLQIGYIYRL